MTLKELAAKLQILAETHGDLVVTGSTGDQFSHEMLSEDYITIMEDNKGTKMVVLEFDGVCHETDL